MRTTSNFTAFDHIPEPLRAFAARRGAELAGLGLLAATIALALALLSWSVQDPSFNHATAGPVRNLLGSPGAVVADLIMQMVGLAAIALLTPLGFWALRLLTARRLERVKTRLALWIGGGAFAAGLASLLPVTARWPLPTGLGGVVGDAILVVPTKIFSGFGAGMLLVAAILAGGAILSLTACVGLRDFAEAGSSEDEEDEEEQQPKRRARPGPDDEDLAGAPGFALVSIGALIHAGLSLKAALARQIARWRARSAPPPARAPWRMPSAPIGEAFDRPLDLAVEPLLWPEPLPEEPAFDANAYAPLATREAARPQNQPLSLIHI